MEASRELQLFSTIDICAAISDYQKAVTQNILSRDENKSNVPDSLLNFPKKQRRSLNESTQLGPSCGKGCRKCEKKVPNNERQKILDTIKAMSKDERKQYVAQTTETTSYADAGNGRHERRNSTRYFLEYADNRVEVCRTLYSHTLGITEYTIRNWLGLNKKYSKPVQEPDFNQEPVEWMSMIHAWKIDYQEEAAEMKEEPAEDSIEIKLEPVEVICDLFEFKQEPEPVDMEELQEF